MQKVQKLLHAHAKSYTIILVVVIIIIIFPADVISTYSDSGEEAETTLCAAEQVYHTSIYTVAHHIPHHHNYNNISWTGTCLCFVYLCVLTLLYSRLLCHLGKLCSIY